MDIIKNILGALLIMICGIVGITMAIGVFGAIVGFCLWLFCCAIPQTILTIGGAIIVFIVIVCGFFTAYHLVDDFRHDRY